MFKEEDSASLVKRKHLYAVQMLHGHMIKASLWSERSAEGVGRRCEVKP